METIHLFPNPYLCLDAKGRLAGACPEIEAVRTSGGMPARRSIGAVLKMVDGTYNADPNEGRGIGGQLAPKAEVMWMFDTIEPIAVVVDASQRASYVARDRAGDVFACDDPLSLPLERLARARNLAVAKWKAAYGDAKLDDAAWEKQFPLDSAVAELAKSYSDREPVSDGKAETAKRNADADKRAAERTKMIEAVSAAAKKLAEKPADKKPEGEKPSSDTAPGASLTPIKPAKKE